MAGNNPNQTSKWSHSEGDDIPLICQMVQRCLLRAAHRSWVSGTWGAEAIILSWQSLAHFSRILVMVSKSEGPFLLSREFRVTNQCIENSQNEKRRQPICRSLDHRFGRRLESVLIHSLTLFMMSPHSLGRWLLQSCLPAPRDKRSHSFTKHRRIFWATASVPAPFSTRKNLYNIWRQCLDFLLPHHSIFLFPSSMYLALSTVLHATWFQLDCHLAWLPSSEPLFSSSLNDTWALGRGCWKVNRLNYSLNSAIGFKKSFSNSWPLYVWPTYITAFWGASLVFGVSSLCRILLDELPFTNSWNLWNQSNSPAPPHLALASFLLS